MNQEGYVLLLRRGDPEEGPINIFETWKNYFDHIIKKETLENAYTMIDLFLWIPQFCYKNKGTRNMVMITHIFQEEIGKN
jgi:hypothetical protein